MSPEQILYIKSLNRYTKTIHILRIAIFVSFLVLWEILARYHFIDAFFFSSPSRIAKCAFDLYKNNHLFTHIGITLAETLLSFIIVMLITIVIASFLWYYQPLADILEPTLVVLNSLPKSALAPLFIVWLGTGFTTIVVAGISVAIFGSVVTLYMQFNETDPEYERLIKTLGGSKKDVFFYVILPGAKTAIFSLFKVNIGLSLVGVIIGEFLAAKRGLGYLIIYGTQVFKLDMVITSILILCIIAFILYKITISIEKK